jgi:hypothetical protein
MASWRDILGAAGAAALSIARAPAPTTGARGDNDLATARPTEGGSGGWFNRVSGWGTVEADAEVSSRFAPVYVAPVVARWLHGGDGIAAKIIDAPIDGALREGYLLAPGATAADEAALAMSRDRLAAAPVRWPTGAETEGVVEAIRALRTTAAVVGGAILVVGFDDGLPLNAPVGQHRGVAWFHVYDATQVGVWRGGQHAALMEPGKLPDITYKVGSYEIHPSRVIPAAGIAVEQELSLLPYPFGGSVYGRVLADLRSFRAGRGSTRSLLHDLSVRIFKLGIASTSEGMQDEQGRDALRAIMGFQQLAASRWRALVVGGDDEVTSTTHSVAGVADLLRASASDLAAAADMPETVLFGRSPAGLSATGESDLENWYGRLRSEQRRIYGPLLARIHSADMRGLRGQRGPVPRPVVSFPPLWVLDAKEEADVNLKQAQAMAQRAQALRTLLDAALLAKAEGLVGDAEVAKLRAALDTLGAML